MSNNMTNNVSEKMNLLQKFSLFFFKRWPVSLALWVVMVVFGLLSYTTLLPRQGFPSIEIPYSVVTATYFVNDSNKVDSQLAKPISAALMHTADVKTVTTQSGDDFATFIVQYKSNLTSKQGSDKIQASLKSVSLPSTASLKFTSVDATKFNSQYDMVVSVYGADPMAGTNSLMNMAKPVVQDLAKTSGVSSAEIIQQYKTGVDPATGKTSTKQVAFDRIGANEGGEVVFRNTVSIGVNAAKGTDALRLYDNVQGTLKKHSITSGHAVISADYAESIRQQVSSLQKNLIEGLIIVIAVSLLLVSWRAGLATALGMVTVLLMTVGALELFGYSLNTITLFALVLCLGLTVDDLTIVSEAIDAGQQAGKTKREVVAEAIRRVARPSMAGTAVTIMTFAPMLFISGIMGDFIKAMPVTIITSLILSFIVSISLIPFLSRRLVLGKKMGLGKAHSNNPFLRLEHAISSSLANIILRAKGRRWRQFSFGLIACLISLGMLAGSVVYFTKLKFDIFPSPKDGNSILMTMTFPAGTTIPQAEHIADDADNLIGQTLGTNLKRCAYLNNGNAETVSAQIELVPYDKRNIKSPELLSKLKSAFTNFGSTEVKFMQSDVGGPKSDTPFQMQVVTEDAAKAKAVSSDMIAYLNGLTVQRTDGTTAHVIKPRLSGGTANITRKDGSRILEIKAGFDATDTSALLSLTQKAVEAKFNSDKLASYGLSSSSLTFDAGQATEEQNSFNSMLLAFPILILAMFILLAVFFRSLLQPLLITMAIPFSFFGVAAGLYYTHNSLSFFVMIGFFALIGIAVNNTIMLVDYANRSLKEGNGYSEAIADALRHRFRPLIATSLTSVVALTPLAMSDPFWESLAFTLIFGLISSTFLVVVAFPYYWLGAEWLRLGSRKAYRRVRGKR
ncbi:MAG TPA: efflux RND transporter permease subunit [Patescibacteria group bacterium]|nr:efflux RND transporter permease subunit [Patescibacteria group bacterium]